MEFETVWTRVSDVTGWNKYSELADFLDIKGPSVAGAKKRGVFPLEWAFKIAQHYHVNTDWLVTGEGRMPRDDAAEPPVSLVDTPSEELDTADQWGLTEEEIVILFEEFWAELHQDIRELVAEEILEKSDLFAKWVKKRIRRREKNAARAKAINE